MGVANNLSNLRDLLRRASKEELNSDLIVAIREVLSEFQNTDVRQIREVSQALENLLVQLEESTISRDAGITDIFVDLRTFYGEHAKDALEDGDWNEQVVDQLLAKLDLAASGGFDDPEESLIVTESVRSLLDKRERAELSKALDEFLIVNGVLHREYLSMTLALAGEKRWDEMKLGGRGKVSSQRLRAVLDRHRQSTETLKSMVLQDSQITLAKLGEQLNIALPDLNLEIDSAEGFIHCSLSPVLEACLPDLVRLWSDPKELTQVRLFVQDEELVFQLQSSFLNFDCQLLRHFATSTNLLVSSNLLADQEILQFAFVQASSMCSPEDQPKVKTHEQLVDLGGFFVIEKLDVVDQLSLHIPVDTRLVEIVPFRYQGDWFAIDSMYVVDSLLTERIENDEISGAVRYKGVEFKNLNINATESKYMLLIRVDGVCSAIPVDQVESYSDLVLRVNAGTHATRYGPNTTLHKQILKYLKPDFLTLELDPQPSELLLTSTQTRILVQAGDDSIGRLLATLDVQSKFIVRVVSGLFETARETQELRPDWMVLTEAPDDLVWWNRFVKHVDLREVNLAVMSDSVDVDELNEHAFHSVTQVCTPRELIDTLNEVEENADNKTAATPQSNAEVSS